MDGDGDVDVLSVSANDNKIAWYENDGAAHPAFTSHTITTNAYKAKSVYTADVDSDGDVDVLSASTNDDKIAWYENDGGSPPVFIGHVITSSADGAESVYAADMDGDGDLDVLSASANDDKIAWYENNGSSSPTFTTHVIAANADWAIAVYAADLDSDGDLDILSASAHDNTIAWYENRGGQFALATANTAPSTLVSGQQDDVLRLVAAHRGRTGDTDAELTTLDLLFEEKAGDPLTTTEANNLIQNLHIYRDTGSGVFEPGADPLVITVGALSLTAGRQTVVLADGDSDVRLVFGAPMTYFIAVELTGNAAAQTPHQFRVTHVTQSSSTAEDRDRDLPLTLEFAYNVASNTVVILPPDPSATPTPPQNPGVAYLPAVLRGYFCDQYEPNDSRATAWGPLTSGQTIHDAKICQGDPRDVYYFDAYAPLQVTIDLKNMPANADFSLFLWDQTSTTFLAESRHGAGQDERIVYALPGAGRYYVDVYPWSGTGLYTLQGSGW